MIEIMSAIFWLEFFLGTKFKKKSWSAIGSKNISNEQYTFAKIHLLAILGRIKIKSFQLIKGTLSSVIIFNFLSFSLGQLSQRFQMKNKPIFVILDNSPMCHSRALKKFVTANNYLLVYTSPNSSFSNPIEYMLGKIKTPLRSHYCMSKWSN